ncbi:MAG TPA: prenyltransferase/squalene oxidase repeat-containing protein [Planctomycetota bacterium]|nr:prenyltransferase/squalene oxidase repeat-containing protein [Planctomycetota bacterium]
MKLRLALLLSTLVAASPALPQQNPVPAHAKVDQQKVDEAIQKGCKFLLTTGNAFATFNHGMRNQPAAVQAYGELVLLTLLHSGYYTEDDPALQPLIKHVNEKIIGSTYTAALMAMALTKLNAKKYQARIVQCGQFLCDNQCENGQWDYGEPVIDQKPVTYDMPKRQKKADDVATGAGAANPNDPKPGENPNDPKPAASTAGKTEVEKKGPGKTRTEPRIPVRKRKPGPPNGDNSNSQYAALGIRACLDANIDVDPSVLQRARQWWLKSQNSDGGWGYNDKGDTGGGGGNESGVSNDSYGSMTVGATGALCIYDYFMGIAYKTDNNVLKGVDWLGKNFDVTKNPKKVSFAYLYYLYGLERAGMLFGTEKFGANEWYPDGANHLLSTQTPAGTWGGADKFPAYVNVDTCFAILFLRRGTPPLKPPVAVATGDPHKPVPNGAPVANGGGGGNRDPGLVGNKGVEAIAPGWRLMNCGPSFQKTVSIRGKENVLQTSEEGATRQPLLRKTIDAAAGISVRATVGHLESDSWTLVVKIDGQEVAKHGVSDQSSKAGWLDIAVDLSSYAGKSVLVELISVAGDAALWSSVSP